MLALAIRLTVINYRVLGQGGGEGEGLGFSAKILRTSRTAFGTGIRLTPRLRQRNEFNGLLTRELAEPRPYQPLETSRSRGFFWFP
jgi:hypothetical protein